MLEKTDKMSEQDDKTFQKTKAKDIYIDLNKRYYYCTVQF